MNPPSSVGGYRLTGRLGPNLYTGESPRGEPVTVRFVLDPLRTGAELDRAAVVDSAHTARILAAGAQDGAYYVVCEYITGTPLREAVARHGPLRGTALDRLAIDTATALTAIHGQGLAHRRIGPDTIIMSPDGPRVTGFGGPPCGAVSDQQGWAQAVAFAAAGRPVLDPDDPGLAALSPTARPIVSACLGSCPHPGFKEILFALLGHTAAKAPARKKPPMWPAVVAGVAITLAISAIVLALTSDKGRAPPPSSAAAGPSTPPQAKETARITWFEKKLGLILPEDWKTVEFDGGATLVLTRPCEEPTAPFDQSFCAGFWVFGDDYIASGGEGQQPYEGHYTQASDVEPCPAKGKLPPLGGDSSQDIKGTRPVGEGHTAEYLEFAESCTGGESPGTYRFTQREWYLREEGILVVDRFSTKRLARILAEARW